VSGESSRVWSANVGPGKHDDLEFKLDKLNRFYVTEIDEHGNKTPIPNGEAQIHEGYGVAEKDRHRAEPVKAVWHDGLEEKEVTVIGKVDVRVAEDKKEAKPLFKNDYEIIYEVEGADEGVPASQLEFPKSLEEQIKGLQEAFRAQAEQHERDIQALNKRLDEALGDNERLRMENERLRNRISELEGRGSGDDTIEEDDDDVDVPPAESDTEPPVRRRWHERLNGYNPGRRFGAWMASRGAGRPIRTETRMIDGVQREVFIEGGRTDGEVIVAVLGGVALGAFMVWAAKNGNHHHFNYDHHKHEGVTNTIHDNDILKDRVHDLQNKVQGLQNTVSIDHVQEMDKLDHISKQLHASNHINGANHHLLTQLHHEEAKEAANTHFNSFNTDSFYGQTPHEAVRNMFSVIKNNDIQVRGVTSHRIDQIASDMMQNHWKIASGTGADHQQNIVDVASDWADGHTQNWNASGLQGLERVNGSTVDSWHRFMHLAARHGVMFSEDSLQAGH
jgi:regulator of replication initiation timing